MCRTYPDTLKISLNLWSKAEVGWTAIPCNGSWRWRGRWYKYMWWSFWSVISKCGIYKALRWKPLCSQTCQTAMYARQQYSFRYHWHDFENVHFDFIHNYHACTSVCHVGKYCAGIMLEWTTMVDRWPTVSRRGQHAHALVRRHQVAEDGVGCSRHRARAHL